MLENLVVLERKDLGENSVIAIPKSDHHKGFKRVYNKAGSLKGLTKDDFGHHDYFARDYLPIIIPNGLTEPTEYIRDAVKNSVQRRGTSGPEFDAAKLSLDQRLLSQIAGYELIQGNLFVVRWKGMIEHHAAYGENKLETKSAAYWVAPGDGKVTVEDGTILVNDEEAEYSNKGIDFYVKSEDFEGELECFLAGKLKMHIKNLLPFASEGSFGGSHSNGPWIIYREDHDQKELDHLAGFFSEELMKT